MGVFSIALHDGMYIVIGATTTSTFFGSNLILFKTSFIISRTKRTEPLDFQFPPTKNFLLSACGTTSTGGYSTTADFFILFVSNKFNIIIINI